MHRDGRIPRVLQESERGIRQTNVGSKKCRPEKKPRAGDRKQQPDAAFWLCCEKAKGAFLTLQQRNACMAYMDYKRLCDRYVVERKMLRLAARR